MRDLLHLCVVFIDSLERLLYLFGDVKKVLDKFSVHQGLCLLNNRLINIHANTLAFGKLQEISFENEKIVTYRNSLSLSNINNYNHSILINLFTIIYLKNG